MEKLRTICFIYHRDYTFEAHYLNEFFKFIGINTYLCPIDQIDILEKSNNSNFDIIVNINSLKQTNEISNVKSISKAKIYDLMVNDCKASEEQLLSDLNNTIINDINIEELKSIIKKLEDVYIKQHLIDVFYYYTTILCQKIEYRYAQEKCDKIKKVVEELNMIMDSIQTKEGMEYLIYAKLYLQIMENPYRCVQGKMDDYDVRDILKYIDNIFLYDDKFYNAYYLMALASNQNSMYSAIPREALLECIYYCKIDVCKSAFYYELGNWKVKHHMSLEPEEHQISYNLNPYLLNNTFRCAINEKKRGKFSECRYYSNQVLNEIESYHDMEKMPISYFELGYKAYMLISNLEPCVREIFIKKASEYIDFIDFVKYMNNTTDMAYAKRLYRNPNELKEIMEAIVCRINHNFEVKKFIHKIE